MFSDSSTPSRPSGASRLALALSPLVLCGHAAAQDVFFSLDNGSVSLTTLAGSGGDSILTPAVSPTVGLLPAPSIHLAGADLLLVSPAEVDAFSYGRDGRIDVATLQPGAVWFSVDGGSLGRACGAAACPWPTVRSETVPGPPREAKADLFVDLGVPYDAAFVSCMATPPLLGFHVGALDGNATVSLTGSGFAYPGLGLVEGIGGDDRLDAFDQVAGTGAALETAYLSLDAVFATGSAAAHGFVGGDVLVIDLASAAPALGVYASAAQLGLDSAGPDSDDLDALAVWENGVPGFQGNQDPNGELPWLDTADMILFSVRRGSAVVGLPDSRLGLPIQPGDVLMEPWGGGALPAILFTATGLGLRSNACGAFPNVDDLDALDVAVAPLLDCNANGQEDAVDIAMAIEPDTDVNGIPDVCGSPACGKPNSCALDALLSATPATLSLAASGSGTLDVTLSPVPAAPNPGFLIYANSGVLPSPIATVFGELCISPFFRAGSTVALPLSTATGCAPTSSYVFDFGAYVAASAGTSGLVAGSTLTLQAWYRDPAASGTANFSSSVITVGTLTP